MIGSAFPDKIVEAAKVNLKVPKHQALSICIKKHIDSHP